MSKISKLLPFKNNSSLTDVQSITAVLAVANAYTLNLAGKAVKNFKIETLDTVAKTIAITNVPLNLLVQLTVKLKYTNAAAITHPVGTVWQNAIVPTFTAGKIYFLQYLSDDGGTTWLASAVGAW